MKLAWLRADSPHAANILDDTAALIEALRLIHDIELFTSDTARDFPATHERNSFDLTVYELDGTPAHAALRPILARYGGALMLRTLSLPELREVLMASRVTVVPYRSVAEDLRVQCPGAQLRVAATGVRDVRQIQRAQQVQGISGRRPPIVFGTLSAGRTDLIRRALDRAGLGGETTALMTGRPPEEVLLEADVIVSVPWPWSGEPATEALAAMAAGKPLVVLETAGTADWPAFDPQSWQPRGPTSETPIVVSVDPLDEEHSLGLAFGRLAADSALRTQLGTAAHDWWRTHATPGHAAADWAQILNEAALSPAMGPRYR